MSSLTKNAYVIHCIYFIRNLIYVFFATVDSIAAKKAIILDMTTCWTKGGICLQHVHSLSDTAFWF